VIQSEMAEVSAAGDCKAFSLSSLHARLFPERAESPDSLRGLARLLSRIATEALVRDGPPKMIHSIGLPVQVPLNLIIRYWILEAD
jgi:hypothetical protein